MLLIIIQREAMILSGLSCCYIKTAVTHISSGETLGYKQFVVIMKLSSFGEASRLRYDSDQGR